MNSPVFIKTIRRVVIFLLALLFLVPFIFTTSTTYPFVFSKVIAFRLLVESIVFFWLALIVYDPASRPRGSTVLTALGVYAAAVMAATFFGVDRHQSLWGTVGRMGGLITLLHVFILVPVAATVLRTERAWQNFFLWGIVTADGMAALGLIQYIAPRLMVFEGGGGRIWAALGNYIYLGQYALFFSVLAFWLAVAGRRRVFRVFAALSGLVQALIIVLTESRGTLLGLGVAAALILGLLWFRRDTVVRLPYRLKIMLGVLVISLAVGFFFFGDRLPGLQAIPGFRRFTFQTLTGGTTTRLMAWQIALKAWLSHPITGWGIENFSYAFDRHYRPELLRFSIAETWFDRAHNGYLDALATTGIFGAAAFVLLYVELFRTLSRDAGRGRRMRQRALFASALLASYLAQLTFAFDSSVTLILLALFMAWVVRIEWGDADSRAPSSLVPFAALGAVALACLAVALGWIAYRANIRPWLENQKVLAAMMSAEEKADLAPMLALAESVGRADTPYRKDRALDLGTSMLLFLGKGNKNHPAAPAALRAAAAMLEQTIREHPADANPRMLLSRVYLASTPHDPSAYGAAIQTLVGAIPLSPKRQEIGFSLGKILYLFGKPAEGLLAIKSAYDLDPEAITAQWEYAVALDASKQYGDAYTLIKRLLYRTDVRNDFTRANEQEFIAKLAFKNGDEPNGHWFLARAAVTLKKQAPAFEAAKKALAAGYRFIFWEDLFMYSDIARDAGDFNEAYRILREGTGSILNSYNEYEKHARYAEAAFAAGDRAVARSEALQALSGGRVRYRRRLEYILHDQP